MRYHLLFTYTSLFFLVELSTFKTIINLVWFLLIFKAKSNLLSNFVQRFFSVKDKKCDLRDFCCFTFYSKTKSKTKKETKRRCFSVVGVKLWNNVFIKIKMWNSCVVFKIMLYKYIFEAYMIFDVISFST